MNMKKRARFKIIFGIFLMLPIFPFVARSSGRAMYVLNGILTVVGIVFFVWGILETYSNHSGQKDSPDEVVINGVHYPSRIFERVNVFVKGGETVFAIRELRQVTGISAEEAQKVIKNWKHYYRV